MEPPYVGCYSFERRSTYPYFVVCRLHLAAVLEIRQGGVAAPTGHRSAASLPSHIKLEQQHVAVFHDVFLAFHAVKPLFTRGGDGA